MWAHPSKSPARCRVSRRRDLGTLRLMFLSSPQPPPPISVVPPSQHVRFGLRGREHFVFAGRAPRSALPCPAILEEASPTDDIIEWLAPI